MNNIQKAVDRFVKDALENRQKVIDDFCKAYLASRAEWFKEKPSRIKNLMLVTKQDTIGFGTTMWFEIKKGKSSK